MRPCAVFVLGIVGLLGGCRSDKLQGSAALAGPGTTTATLHVDGPVVIWADTDVSWKGPEESVPVLDYDLEVKQKGKSVANVACSTAQHGAKICGLAMKRNGDERSRTCQIELRCEFPAVTGDVDVKVTGRSAPNIVAVNKMGLDFRARKKPKP